MKRPKRRFHSYGPVNEARHFVVPRRELVDNLVRDLVGDPPDGGHYFTVWAPRQTGKTWLIRKALAEISRRHGNRFQSGIISMQGVVMEKTDSPAAFLNWTPDLLRDGFGIKPPVPESWHAWVNLFHRDEGVFDRPVILFIDEIDALPADVLDRIMTLFRSMYLDRDSYRLHGLALVGVRAVLGLDSGRGSPFNVQRSMRIPGFTVEEVRSLFDQYEAESGQAVDPAVVKALYEATRGQPGLVCWFGELLTETYNPGPATPIDPTAWKEVYRRALTVEWNNTVLNLVTKARGPYRDRILALFTRSDIHFSLDAPWCGFAYLNGIIDYRTETRPDGENAEVCCFANPFIQQRIHAALTTDLVGDRMPDLVLHPLDDLSDVLDGPDLDLEALLRRYTDYLKRLKAAGIDPWKDQPRRSDLRLTEAVSHFHLYAWLLAAIGRRCAVSPEFPTGNGKVDLHIRCGDKRGIIEVKSFVDAAGLTAARRQAAGYARRTGTAAVSIALFVPMEDESVLKRLSGVETIDGVRVAITAIGWT